MKIFIVGSCVSRDITTYFLNQGHELLHYAARQSLISAGSSVNTELLNPSLFRSPFQLRSMQSDFKGDLYTELSAKKDEIDVIIWDLIDERRGVLKLPEQRYVTNNWELYDSKQIEELEYLEKIELGTKEHFKLWSQSVEKFMRFLRDNNLKHKLVLIAPMFAAVDEDGDEVPAAVGDTWRDLRSKYWEYFDYVEGFIPEQIARVEDDGLLASKKHRWGLQSYHYSAQTEGVIASKVARLFPIASLAMHEYEAFMKAREIGLKATRTTNAEIKIQENIQGVPLNGLFLRRRNSEPLTVFFNGAVNRSISGNKVVYQRSTWRDSLSGNLLFISDGTTDLYENINIGWGQGNGDILSSHLAAGLVQGISEGLRGDSLHDKTYLFGSSAGGFQALYAASYLPGSNVMVNNPQIDWLKYEVRDSIKKLIETVYVSESQAGFRDRHATAVDLKTLWKFVGQVPNFLYLLNVASKFDIDLQYKPLIDFINNNPGLLIGGEFSVKPYSHPNEGHSPLGREETVQIIDVWQKRNKFNLI